MRAISLILSNGLTSEMRKFTVAFPYRIDCASMLGLRLLVCSSR